MNRAIQVLMLQHKRLKQVKEKVGQQKELRDFF
jgi:hypothetical protein